MNVRTSFAWRSCCSARLPSAFLMKVKPTLRLMVISVGMATTACAPQPGATGGAVVASEPGKAAVVRAAEISAQVVGLDKATRTLTLKGPNDRDVTGRTLPRPVQAELPF